MVKAIFAAFGLLVCGFFVQAQTVDEEALERRYWNFRERMRLKHVKLNRDPGGGSINPKLGLPMACGEVDGWSLGGGDVGMEMGIYLGALALEYANLVREGKEVDPVLSEIYYAVNSIRRIDENAEPFFNSDEDESFNGFFLRNDFPQSYYQDYENQGENMHTISCNSSVGPVPAPGAELTTFIRKGRLNNSTDSMNFTWYSYPTAFDSSIYEFPDEIYIANEFGEHFYSNLRCRLSDNGINPFTGETVPPEFRDLSSNEMSQDQLIGYLFGLSFIQKFVPDLFLQPTALDRGFQLHTEIRQLVFAWMTFLSSQRVFGGNETHAFKVGNNCYLNYETKSNWIISNPVNNTAVRRGWEMFLYAYPIERTCGRLYGAGWNNLGPISTQFTTGHRIDRVKFYTNSNTSSSCLLLAQGLNMSFAPKVSTEWSDWRALWHNAFQHSFDSLALTIDVSRPNNPFYSEFGFGIKDQRTDIDYPVGILDGNAAIMMALKSIGNRLPDSDALVPQSLAEYFDFINCIGCDWLDDRWWAACRQTPPANCPLGPPLMEMDFYTHDNAEMAIKLAITSDTWHHDSIVHWATLGHDMFFYDIVDAVLNDRTCTFTKADYEALLSLAPDDYIRNVTETEWAARPEKYWFTQNLFRFSTYNQDGTTEVMHYPGHDYAFMYNLYRFYYQDSIETSYDPENACQCYNTVPLPQAFSSDQSTPDRFPYYRELGYSTPDWIHDQIDIYNGGSLTVNGDLNLCSKVPGYNSAQISVTSDSEVELTASPSGLPKQLRVRKNSRLYLQGGKLTVGDNSQVIIEKGGTLRVEDKSNGLPAEIVLDGDNAVLQIEGTLDIGDHSEFTVSGTGKVVFYSYDPDCIKFGENSKFTLNGNGPGDIIMEVMTDRLNFLDQDAKKVSITDGTILLANGTVIESSVPLELGDVTVTKRHPNDQPKGWYLRGQEDVDIDDCHFSNMTDGIFASRFLTGKSLKIRYSTFSYNDYGLRVEGGGVKTIGCNFFGNNTAIFTAFCTLPSTLMMGNIYANGEGVVHLGGDLHLSNPNIHDNTLNGVDYFGGSLSAWCGSIKDNTKGIKGWGDELILSNKYRRETGYVDLSGNVDAVVFRGRALRVDEGYNDFSTVPNPLFNTNLGLDILIEPSYSQSNNTYRQFRANHNVWGLGGANFPVEQELVLSNYGNYEVLYNDDPTAPARIPLAGSTNPVVSIPSCPTYTPNEKWKPRFPEDENTSHHPENGTPELADPDPDGEFNGENVDTAIVVVLKKLYNDTATGRYENATGQLANILLIAENETWEYGPDVYLDYLYNYAYQRMMEAFGYAMVEEDIRTTNPSLGNLVIQVQQHLIDQIEQSTDENFAEEHTLFRLYYDMATTQWALNDHALAANTFTQMLTWVTGDALQLTTHALCRVNYEKQVIDGLIPLSYPGDGSYPCVDPMSVYGVSSATGITAINEQEPSEKVQGLTLYPNPAKNRVFVHAPFVSGNADMEVVVYDIQGKEVLSTTVTAVTEGLFTFKTESLKDGLYMVECRMGTEQYQSKLSVLRK